MNNQIEPRIRTITEILSKSEENNFSLRIEKSGKNDELDKLADALNAILEKAENQGKEIQDKNSIFLTIRETTPVAILRLDPDGKILKLLNPVAEKLLGLATEEAAGKTLCELLINPNETNQLQNFRDSLCGAKPISGFPVNRKKDDGATEYYRVYTSLIRGKDRQVAGIIAMIEDITERSRAEAALKNSEEKYRSVVESSIVGVYIIQDGLYRFVNNRWCEIFGYTREEAVDKMGPLDTCLPEYREEARENLARRLSGDRYEQISKAVTKTGEIIDLSFIGGAITYNGRPAISGSVVDISERTRTLEALRQSESKLRSILDNIKIGVTLISPEMKILEGNRIVQERFPDVNLNQHPVCYELFNNPPRENACEFCPVQKTFQDGLVHEAVTPGRRPGNESRTFRITSSPVLDDKNEIISVIEMTEDITERSTLEAQLRQAQKMEAVGSLAGGVAHDFNNLLSVIFGYTELSLAGIGESHAIHSNLKQILNAANRSSEIVRQLLAFARKQTISPRVISLNDTIENILKIIRRMIGEDINLTWNASPDLWLVNIDPVQIEQILVNLCVNARDAIAGVGKIEIETDNMIFDELYCKNHAGAKYGEYAVIAVSDNGSGIEKENIEKIFDPFFSTKPMGQGTGLGLATVFGIVKQNNGFINVYSEINSGTTFKIYLPRHIGQEEKLSVKACTEPAAGAGETILIVEDEPMILELAGTMLESFKYNVLTARTPAEALKLADEISCRIHLLLTDVILPDMNGKALAEKLSEKCPGLKCMYMSGYTANVIAHRGLLDEGVNFLQKPFTMNSLSNKVREVLDKK